MIEIDPEDGLPVDLEAAVRAADDERVREEGEDRAEFAHLYEGEWMSTADAVTALVDRGSERQKAELTLLLWLQTNDGQRPHLRARAEQAARHFLRPEYRDPSIRRDAIVHSWDWSERLAFADWGSGTFVIEERQRPGEHCSYELRLIGVSVSKDDLARRLEPTAVKEQVHQSQVRKATAKPSTLYDLDAFLLQAVEFLKDEGGLQPAYNRSKLFADMDAWCSERWPKVPGRSWMFSHFGAAQEKYLSSLSSQDSDGLTGRPSAS